MQINIPNKMQDVADEIAMFTGLRREEVDYRLRMEKLDQGWNVRQDVERFGVKPHNYDENMIRLYEHGDSFIFETLVFWMEPERQYWTQLALERISLYTSNNLLNNRDVTILMFGDGTGNDSLCLVMNGYNVDYFDVPGSRTFDFTTRRFEHYGLLGTRVRIINDYSMLKCTQYDAIISFDVLEHLPNPKLTICEMAGFLKQDGMALVTEDFGNIEYSHPTHLATNTSFHGKTAFLFLRNNMLLTWYCSNPLFKPTEFRKIDEITARHLSYLLADMTVLRKLITGRWHTLKSRLRRVSN